MQQRALRDNAVVLVVTPRCGPKTQLGVNGISISSDNAKYRGG
jgi:hypothetical protein